MLATSENPLVSYEVPNKKSNQPLLSDSSSVLIPDMDDRLPGWVEHFSQLLNRPLGRPVEIVPASVPCYETNSDLQALEETTNVIHHSKSRKVSDETEIHAEICKMCFLVVTELLHTLFPLICYFSKRATKKRAEITETSVC